MHSWHAAGYLLPDESGGLLLRRGARRILAARGSFRGERAAVCQRCCCAGHARGSRPGLRGSGPLLPASCAATFSRPTTTASATTKISHRHLGSPWRVSKRSNARSASKRPRSFATTCRNLTAFRRPDLRRPLAPLAAGRRQEAASRRRRRTLTRGQNSGHRRCGPFSAGGVPWFRSSSVQERPPVVRGRRCASSQQPSSRSLGAADVSTWDASSAKAAANGTMREKRRAGRAACPMRSRGSRAILTVSGD